MCIELCRIVCLQPLSNTNYIPHAIISDEDWHAIWWNGMGRFLLDGRNPQPYGEAVKVSKIWSSDALAGYKELLFKIIEQGAAFNHAKQFIEET